MNAIGLEGRMEFAGSSNCGGVDPPISWPGLAGFAGLVPGGDGRMVIAALPTVSAVWSSFPLASWKLS